MDKPLKGKTILLGVTGGIAAYKAATLCSRLVSLGASVRVIMTEGATQFITPLTLQVLTRNSVATDVFDERDATGVQHIDLADAADLAVIAPATANILSKLANGLADDMLSTTLLATTAPLLIAPAMNVHMWEHPAVIDNVNKLASRGVTFVEPGTGQLACGYVGKGRLAEPDEIVDAITAMLVGPKPLSGKRVLVTAGGTVERIDPVRYITNDSSGKMGFAIAEAARDRGAEVTLVCGRTDGEAPNGVHIVKVNSARQMYDAVMASVPNMDFVVKAAAVADYRPMHQEAHKMKKTSEAITLELVRNPDILQAIGDWRAIQPDSGKPFVIGFAAETMDVEKHALDKLNRKKCDLIVANNVAESGAGFGTETNIVSVYGPQGLVEQIPQMPKRAVAERLWDLAEIRMNVTNAQGDGKGTAG
ncbi:bifunctional phosphopantothenoylcysteine decarboxylase/phosphopantothenate--cysteine ligase CoaBC [Cohnella silvisoli]|uniref:Coenzyme A biosynthesis bifunctional protein CoaBC n=1 Tax=Cohnella silvisoli TaxID=2873699 RepID=A0ABV1KUT2_9BACL|nr:bifunctional phosphopantothenoylcysteine decarboxylase/phosphopantothenate--cysteine ligase CoaBC [Cohnella silvisoli]MCD9023255.1 bifunctional phosphopantothenoylcysteine decarboxylase/phosphopantothenate--cysteine ligase CoaBC [Cohnella silvisoli]